MQRSFDYATAWNELLIWANQRKGRVIGGRELVERMRRTGNRIEPVSTLTKPCDGHKEQDNCDGCNCSVELN